MSDISTPVTTEPRREIGTRLIGAGEARSAIMERTYDAPIEDVWDACTNPERLQRWFLALEGDLKLGGTYVMGGFAGGEILQCEAPRLVTVTWDVEGYPVDEVELRLSEAPGGGTLLQVEHATTQEGVTILSNMGSGWEPGLVALDMELHGEMHGTLDIQEFRSRPQIEAVIERARVAWTELANG